MIQTYFDNMRRDVEEFIKTGRVQKAIELSQETGHHFNWSEAPQYFVGKLDAKFVMIHLNPKQKDVFVDRFSGVLQWEDFDDYFSYHTNFGNLKYGKDSDRTHKSPFDHKQIRFLKVFDVIDFVAEKTQEDKFLNLERVIDHKLQLEIIPYGSDTFSAAKMNNHIKGFLSSALNVISAYPRDYILFCGSVFDKIFADSIIKTEKFKLRKNDGSLSVGDYRFSILEFFHNGKPVKAGLAHSYAIQGLPMVEYGKKCAELYRKHIG